jgi:hypothetical protein
MTTTAARLQSEYRKLRDELLEAEIALKDQRESVAALRRQLPMMSSMNPLASSRMFVCLIYLRRARIGSSWFT